MFTPITGRSVLVTGGTKGIGNGIAAVFLRAGARVTIVGRDSTVGAQAASEVSGMSLHVLRTRSRVSMASSSSPIVKWRKPSTMRMRR